ncbi:MAG: hypothetical protein AAF570_03675 [Bacteroidota bacterium]
MRRFLSIWLFLCVSEALLGQNPGDRMRLAPPIMELEQAIFEDSVVVKLHFGMEAAELEWKADAGKWNTYEGRIVRKKSGRIWARSTAEGFEASEAVHCEVIKMGLPFDIISQSAASSKYPGRSLQDGLKARNDFKDAQWMGFDLDTVRFRIKGRSGLKSVRLEFLEDRNSWIMAPEIVQVCVAEQNGRSVSGKCKRNNWKGSERKLNGKGGNPVDVSAHLDLPKIKVNKQQDWELMIVPATLPDGHPGAGKKAWIFMDEILVYKDKIGAQP